MKTISERRTLHIRFYGSGILAGKGYEQQDILSDYVSLS
jgi:hypothetical protein